MAEKTPRQSRRQTDPVQVPPDYQRLVHELQIHQVELEVQNQEILAARVEVEAALARYADFYDFAPVGFLTLDSKGIIRAANLTASTMLGLHRTALIGRKFSSFLGYQWRAGMEAALQRVFRGDLKETSVAELLPGSQVRFVRVEAGRSSCGEECRAVLVDVTEQRSAEEELSRLNAELEGRVLERTAELEVALREQEAFNYTVSHDLRGPLRHINSYTALLMEDFADDLPPGAAGYLNRVKDLSRHMGDLIDHLLNLARIGRWELEKQRVDLSALAAAVADLLRESHTLHAAELWIQPGMVTTGDKVLLRLVLENLLSNACKYSAKQSSPRVEVCSEVRDGRTVFLVRDNGVGFDMIYSGQLFGVFQRLHGSEFPGLGIGLATVKKIIERHGGQIWAESQVNRGAVFYFTLEGATPLAVGD